MIGKTLSHYCIEEKLGSGGMGVVYRAKDTKLDRDVAVKVLKEELASDPERLRRFEQEVRAASALDHPNIITIHDISESAGIHYIVMQYVEGKTLKEMLSEGPLPTKKLFELATQIAEGLAKAHSGGIIHRDLKPANLMVTEDGFVKILDFGLAKLLSSPSGVDSELETLPKEGTAVGTVMGTVGYMSPEQAKGATTDFRTDQFSLGSILYEVATGRRPFQGETLAALFEAIIHETPASPSSLNTEIGDELDRIVHKALEKDLSQRYTSVAELLRDLRAAKTEVGSDRPRRRSIVVLPFEDISPDRDNAYFSDGLTEEIISDLSKIHSMQVISRTSAMRLKGIDKDLKTIGKELNVRYVLEGSVRKAGNKLRITAQLIDSTNDIHLWAEKYGGTLDDIFDIQEKVSGAIVDALKLKLTSEEKQEMARRPIDDVRAYECYLRAWNEFYRFKEDALERGIQYLETALDIIGENALLYSSMGYMYCMYFNIGDKVEEKYLEKAEFYADRVLELKPDSPHLHSLRGMIAIFRGSLKSAATHLKRAYDRNPNDSGTLFVLLLLLFYCGKTSVAEEVLGKLFEIDPLSPVYHTLAALVHYMKGQFDLALESAEKGYQMNPDTPPAQLYYGYFLKLHHRIEEACSVLDGLTESSAGTVFSSVSAFMKWSFQGEREKAIDTMTPEVRSKIRKDKEWSWLVADGCALIDEKEEALDWLEYVVSFGFINYPLLSKHDPFLENIRGEERFKQLMERVKREWESFEV